MAAPKSMLTLIDLMVVKGQNGPNDAIVIS